MLPAPEVSAPPRQRVRPTPRMPLAGGPGAWSPTRRASAPEPGLGRPQVRSRPYTSLAPYAKLRNPAARVPRWIRSRVSARLMPDTMWVDRLDDQIQSRPGLPCKRSPAHWEVGLQGAADAFVVREPVARSAGFPILAPALKHKPTCRGCPPATIQNRPGMPRTGIRAASSRARQRPHRNQRPDTRNHG